MKLSKPDTDRWTAPVIERYVRRLIHDNDAQYREWLLRNAPAALSKDTTHAE